MADLAQRPPSSLLLLILTAVIAVCGVIVAISPLEALLKGVSVSSIGPTGEITAGVLGVAIYFSVFLFSSWLFRWRYVRAHAAPQNLVREAVTFCDRAREIWSMSSTDLTSFRYATQAIQNALYPSNPFTGLTQLEEQNRSMAIGSIFAWRTTDSTATNSTTIARRMLTTDAEFDRDSFWLALEMVEIRIGASMNLANQIAEKFQGTSFTLRATGLSAEWNRFREAANRLAEDYTTFRRRVAQELNQGTIPRFVSVSELPVPPLRRA